MRTLVASAVLTLLLLALPAVAAVPPDVDLKKISSHLKEHQHYPATREQLITACYDLKDFSDNEKKWFLSTLPNRTFKSADEVVSALSAAK